MPKKMQETYIHLRIISFVLLFSCGVFLSGCYTKSVRHLTSDVSLLEKGSSTDQDVLVFLGDPDWQEQGENGITRWVYQDRKKSLMQKIPFSGDTFGEEGRTTVVISLQNHIVEDIDYRITAPNELGWQRSSQ